MASSKQEDLIRKLSHKYDLPLKVINEICAAPTTFVAKNMSKSDETTIFISGLGRFGVKPYRKKLILDIVKKKHEAQVNSDASGTSSPE
jgi:hypothetical protein